MDKNKVARVSLIGTSHIEAERTIDTENIPTHTLTLADTIREKVTFP